MNTITNYSKAFLLLVVAMLTMAVTSCSEDTLERWDGTYGYVQFMLSKKVSSRVPVPLPSTSLRNWAMPRKSRLLWSTTAPPCRRH